jgi:hypothetical protein
MKSALSLKKVVRSLRFTQKLAPYTYRDYLEIKPETFHAFMEFLPSTEICAEAAETESMLILATY